MSFDGSEKAARQGADMNIMLSSILSDGKQWTASPRRSRAAGEQPLPHYPIQWFLLAENDHMLGLK